MIEGLFVGLVMMCLDSARRGGEKALLINATVERCGEGGCTVCSGYKIDLHRPQLLVRTADMVPELTTAHLTKCDSIRCGGRDISTWDLLGKEICFNVGPGSPRKEPGRAQGNADPWARNASAKALDWIPSITRFHTGFELRDDLTPGTRNPVAASVKLGPGNLHAERLGMRGAKFSHWRAEPDGDAIKADFPRALAEAIIWKTQVEGDLLEISDCRDSSKKVVLSLHRAPPQGRARFIVSNLPDPCSGAPAQRKLTHFGAYYELADSIPCAVPELVKGEKPPDVKLPDFGRWLVGLGKELGDLSEKLRQKECPEVLETTLCPPSKFP